MELFSENREEFLAYSRLTILNRFYAKNKYGMDFEKPSMNFEDYLNFIEENKVYDKSLSRRIPENEKKQTDLNIKYKGNRTEELAVLDIINKSYNLGLVNQYGVLTGDNQKIKNSYNIVERNQGDSIAKTIEDYKKKMVDYLIMGDEEENKKEREKFGSDEKKQVEFNEKMGLETYKEKDIPNKTLFFNMEDTEEKEKRDEFIKREDHLKEQKS